MLGVKRMIVCGIVLSMALGCDQYVAKSKYEATAKELADTAAQLKAAQAANASASNGRYVFESYGPAHDLMRLDTASGETCLVNTPRVMNETRAEIIHQTCDWMDAVTHGSTPADADCAYVPGVCKFPVRPTKK
jgi:hypothetical protein